MSRISDLIDDLVAANRILAHENVVDAFGHVSVRHPETPASFSSCKDHLVRPSDIKAGLCYKTADGHLRMVVKAINRRVWFISRKADNALTEWNLSLLGIGIDAFAKSVERVVPVPPDAPAAVELVTTTRLGRTQVGRLNLSNVETLAATTVRSRRGAPAKGHSSKPTSSPGPDNVLPGRD